MACLATGHYFFVLLTIHRVCLSFKMKILKSVCFSLLLLFIGNGLFSCSNKNKVSENNNPAMLSKINFDLQQFDANGLYGPADGKRAMDYEFCIPREETKIEKVKVIDPKVVIQKGSSGRIGCSKTQYLCISNTNQKDFKKVLMALANLDYIERIDPTYFE